MKPGPKITPTDVRFFKFVDKWYDGCWRWMGGFHHSGYGLFTPYQSKTVWAHRFSYELAKGPIPDGLVIDHLCRVPSCVNPDHLEAVTPRENALRGNTIPAANAAKTHCKNGHEYTPENTYLTSKNQRQCRICNKVKNREAAERWRRRQGIPERFPT